MSGEERGEKRRKREGLREGGGEEKTGSPKSPLPFLSSGGMEKKEGGGKGERGELLFEERGGRK